MPSTDLLAAPRPWLYVPVQVKVRELVAKVLQAVVAAERGYGTVLGTHRRLRPSLHWLPPGIVWDYSATYPLLELFRRYSRAGHTIVASEEEGLVEIPNDAFVGVDRYVAWGDDEAERILRARPDGADRLRVTGHPRFDLLRPELRELHRAEVDALNDRIGRFILVNTNFPANVQFGVSVLQQTYQHDTQGFTEEDQLWFVERDDYSLRMFRYFQEMVVEVADAFPGHTVVVRPHPSENDGAWSAAVANVKNVHVERTGGVVPWLLAADALVHNGCTTGIEGHLVGTSVVAYRPIAESRFDWELPNEVSTQVTSIDQLVDELRLAVAAVDAGERRPPAGSEILRRHVAAMDGPLAAERIADVLDEVRPTPARLPHGSAAVLRARGDHGLITLKHLGNLALRRTRIPLAFEKQKNPGWDAAEVNVVLAALRRASNRFQTVRAVDLWPDVVALVAT